MMLVVQVSNVVYSVQCTVYNHSSMSTQIDSSYVNQTIAACRVQRLNPLSEHHRRMVMMLVVQVVVEVVEDGEEEKNLLTTTKQYTLG